MMIMVAFFSILHPSERNKSAWMEDPWICVIRSFFQVVQWQWSPGDVSSQRNYLPRTWTILELNEIILIWTILRKDGNGRGSQIL